MNVINSGYEHDISLEHRFARTIKAILGLQFITQDPSEDRNTGTDFMVWSLLPIKIACRLRRHEFYLRYPDEFTIRWSRPSRIDTEIHKIRKGLVDYLLYGFVDKEEKRIISYFIGSLMVFRTANVKPQEIKTNYPPDSQLAVYSLGQFPSEFVVKRYDTPTYTVKQLTG